MSWFNSVLGSTEFNDKGAEIKLELQYKVTVLMKIQVLYICAYVKLTKHNKVQHVERVMN